MTLHATPLEDIVARLTPVVTMSADFRQTTFDKHGHPLQIDTGKVYLKRPDHLLWETQTPQKHTVLITAGEVWQFDPELAQLVIQQLDPAANTLLAVLLNDFVAIERDFTVAQTHTDSFTLAARQPEHSSVTRLELQFQNQQLSSLVFVSALEHQTKIDFENSLTNISLPSSLFQLEVPEGVDIIKTAG